jgi:hypothetical protein
MEPYVSKSFTVVYAPYIGSTVTSTRVMRGDSEEEVRARFYRLFYGEIVSITEDQL